MRGHRGGTITLGGVVAAGQEGNAGFARQVRLGLGDFAREESIGTGRDGIFEVTLRAPGAPRDAAQRPAIAGHQHRVAPQLRLHRVRQGWQALQAGRCPADETQRLLAETCIGDQAQTLPELGVVAEFGMRVQRQVVGIEIDAGIHQAPHARAQPARQPPVLAAPEQAVVHQQGVSAGGDGGIDESQAGGDARDDAAHLGPTLDLQTVRPIILESLWLQQLLQEILDLNPICHGAHCRARMRKIP